MAERILEELLVVLHGKKCFKGIMENSEDIIGSLNVAGIARECLNLDKNFKKLQVVNSPSNLTNLQTRDGILHKLSLLWDLFHALVAKRNSCCSLDKFCQRICEEDLILQMLFTCLGSEDHFITFQAQKIVREIVQGFPEIVLQSTFQELVSNCLKENGKWKSIYIIEIIKEVLTLESNLLCEEEKLHSYPTGKCDCLLEGRNLVLIDFEAIQDTVTHYWVDLCSKCLLKFPLIAEEKQSEINLNKQSCYVSVQHALASLLSIGSIIMQSSHKTYQQAATTNEIIQSSSTYFKETSQCNSFEHKPRYTTTMNINDSQSYPLCQSSEETQNTTIDENPCHESPGEQSKYVNIMESVYEIVRKLVGIDKQELSLDLRRTVVQFLNDVVSDNPQNESELCVQGHLVGICIFLLENVDQLLENGTKITTDIHFGGQNFSEKLEAENLVYDKVITRKVLLLVLKSVLIILHAQEERSKYSNWEVLKYSLESWLNFVRKAIGESSENFHHSDKNKTVAYLVVMLFADQDDELMTVLLCLFNLYQELFLNESSLPVTEWTNNLRSNFNPHCFFLEFLHSIHCDHSLLLDFMISNETCFLSYFLSYLRHAANDWFGFLAVCNHSALLSIKNNYAGLSSSDDGGGGSSDGSDSDGDDGSDSGGDDGSDGGDDGSDSDGDDGSDGGDDGSGGGSGDGNDDGYSDGGGGSDGSGHDGDDGSGGGDGGDSDSDDGTGGGSDGGDSNGDDDGGGDDGKGGGGDDHYNELIEDYQGPNDDYNDHIDDIDDIDEDKKSYHNEHDADNYCNQRVSDSSDGVVCTMVGTTRNVNQDHVFSPLLSLSNVNHFHQSLSCLIRLRFSIERMISKGLFPYPVQALVRVIKYIESLYEGE